MTQTIGFEANEADQAFLKALKEQMPPDMPVQRILAIVSQFVGQLVAMQDASHITADMAMQIVSENIGVGNRAQLLAMVEPEGSS